MKWKSNLQDMHLLYVESDTALVTKNLEILNNYFENIIVANSLEDALVQFEHNMISMLITELETPSIDGIKLIDTIKQKDKNIICMVLSEKNDPESFLKTIELGIDSYLMKPLQSEAFENVLEKSVEKLELLKEHQQNIAHINIFNQYKDIVNKSTIISKTDARGVITYVNDNFCKASEFSQKELLGKNHNMVRHPDNDKAIFQDLWDTIKHQKKEWTGILKNRTKYGKTYYVKSSIKPILNEEGEIVEYIGIRNNVSAVMSDKKHLIDQIASNNLSLLVLIQIEEFEILDKFYNIETINKLEKMFGYELMSYLPSGYIFENIYNLGNGRFALLTDFYDYIRSEQNINMYLEELVGNVKHSIMTIDEIEYDLNIIISYSFGKENLYEDAKCGLDEVIENKELIKYANDSSIKEHIVAKKNLQVMNMVKIALDNYNIISHFQPIINNKTKQVEKYESLVRLVDENGNILSPFHFLDISKKGNYYNKITLRVLENSFKILDHISTKLSINISSVDIEKEETRKRVYELLEEYETDRHRVVFELLEDEDVKDFNVIKRFIKKVKSMGVQIAIDDFGAGYSNFERLLEFEPDILKIDGSLIKNIVSDAYSRNVVETIVTFAQKQNIQTIAEFVENEEIFNILNVIGVDYSQGYYFGKPEHFNNLHQTT